MIASRSPRSIQASALGRRTSHRIAFELIDWVKRDVYKCGSRLPTKAELLREFRVSRTAPRGALMVLRCLDLVETQRGGALSCSGRNGHRRLVEPLVGPVSKRSSV